MGPPRQAENIKKKICEIFSRHELAITADMKGSTVDFLDVTFDLRNGSFKPYNKPGNIPQYVHRLSNHPPTIIKNIPEGINRRLSSISSSPEIFSEAAPMFQEALVRSGYDYKLEYKPATPK